MKRVRYMNCDSLNMYGKFEIYIYANIIEDKKGIIQISQQEFYEYQLRVAKVVSSMQNPTTMRDLYLTNSDKNIEIIKIY